MPQPPLYVYNGGLLTNRRVRRILHLSGWDVRVGWPKGPDDWVGVWGQSPTAWRGRAVARRTGASVLCIEDAFLRSVLPGRAKEPPMGLCLDRAGIHFDPSQPSELEQLLATEPLDDTALLDAARNAMERITYWQLSKYNDFDPASALPDAPYVLVIDQTRDDASVRASGADAAIFREMLVFAQAEHPGNRVLIKSHPESVAGYRPGYFDQNDENERVTILRDNVSPWALMQGATGVYTVSSQLGFEAIFAGHRPRVFGQPFYAGWGLSDDENPVPRRSRKLTRAQLFAASMLMYPTWYDPHLDRLCGLEEVIDTLAARARGHREDRAGYTASGIRPWKRPHMRRFFGAAGIRFFQTDQAARRSGVRSGRKVMAWGASSADGPVIRVEDGFLRSRGLGARLVPPLSLVADDLGIYYDPSRPNRLDQLISQAVKLPGAELRRAAKLVEKLTSAGLSKYNLGGARLSGLPQGRRILVPGQVEDDASIRLGCPGPATNLDLLRETRRLNPDACILFKPHPDVEAGLRPGRVEPEQALELADVLLDNVDIIDAIDAADEVWTLTSLTGFEALLRGRAVTCLGLPFYAGWGLTRDLQPAPSWREARPDLAALAHAVLIGYPRYHDPMSNSPCPPEICVRRLTDDDFQFPTTTRILMGLHVMLPPRWAARGSGSLNRRPR